MSHSNSSLNCFASCMAKYEQNYILHAKPCKPESPHLRFGVMAHDVLYKAGQLRDQYDQRIIEPGEYSTIIPSEVLYSDLKTTFDIPNWHTYFTQVIKQVAEYESDLIKQLIDEQCGHITVEREVKIQLTVDELKEMNIHGVDQPFVGIIDLLLITPTHAIIIDYKFSSNKKTQDDFDLNSQLPLYAFFVNTKYGVKLHNIRYGYIDIPKKAFDKPALLSNGTLSRSKSQNVSQELYAKAVEAVHGDDKYYNCKPGGYYYDIWCNLALNKAAYLTVQYLDYEIYDNIIRDLINAARMIDLMISEDLPFLKKYDSYSCKSCEFMTSCKKYLTMEDNW